MSVSTNDTWGTSRGTTSRESGNFNTRVMGLGDSQLRDFVSQNIVSTANQSVMDRITKYALFFNFYSGKHWKDWNETFLTFNYIKAFIDKVIFFIVGKESISFQVRSLSEDSILRKIVEDSSEEGPSKHSAEEIRLSKVAENAERFIMRNWNLNKRKILVQEILQMGSVCGDCYVSLAYDSENKFVRYNLIDSRFGIPYFDKDTRDGDMSRFEIRVPLPKNDSNYVLKVYSYDKENIKTWYQKNVKEGGDKEDIESSKNPYGFIPIIHIRNRPNLGQYFSVSDVEGILPLNKIYNEMNQQLKTIIDYHSAPTTVITGANAKALKRGVGNIWSGLPVDANVFNLTLDSDLGAAMQFTERIKTSMHEFSDVPENTLGQLQPISNTSGAALELTYQPLLQQADTKKTMYGDGFTEINKMTISMLNIREFKGLKTFDDLPKDFNEEYRIEPTFTYGFPKDRASELGMAQQEINMGIGSRREWMEKLGKNNVTSLLREIEEEKKALKEDQESDKSSKTEDPTDNGKGNPKVNNGGDTVKTDKKEEETVEE